MRIQRAYLLPGLLCAAGLLLVGLQFALRDRATEPLPATPAMVSLLREGHLETLPAPGNLPANWLAKAGMRWFPGDSVRVDGRLLEAQERLPPSPTMVLQVDPARAVTLVDGGAVQVIYSAAASLGEALSQAGIRLDPADRLDLPLDTRLDGPLSATLTRAVPLTIQTGELQVRTRSAADTVGYALAEAGIALQGLDYTLPAEDQPVPPGGSIQVVRVQEQTLLEQTQVPFKSSYQADPETELDQRRVITPGQTGLIVHRVHVRLEDGKEVSRRSEGEWVARQPQDQLVGYGTKVVLHTEVVDGVTITYWRKIQAYATSYAPCEIYTDHCSYTTASGMTLQKGVAAVVRSWYSSLKGAQIYVPGYGQATIADIGGGVGGQNWVDLGYSDSDYVGWHSVVDVYFLAPAPANVGWGLP